MGLKYAAVGWNRQKRIYDLTLSGGVAAYLVLFAGAAFALHPSVTIETVLIRGFGSAALVLLHVILMIGPLCRLESRFLPLLYNRRHLGVTMFFLATAHGALSIVQFHALGDTNPLVSVLVANPRIDSVSHFPFQPLGLAALAILFLMAATSHDFWLTNLSAPVWKSLHMGVYVAYALIVLHVALGVLQAETNGFFAVALGTGVAAILTLHVAAALRERSADRAVEPQADERFVDVCAVSEIPEGRARAACISGERVAIFRYDGKISALSSVCRHQNGPLGEGRVIDGCVTCPWHGYQYHAESGASPPPFTETVPTFDVRVVGNRVEVDPRPHPPGTTVEPARDPLHDGDGRTDDAS